jgi:hypothetical protein
MIYFAISRNLERWKKTNKLFVEIVWVFRERVWQCGCGSFSNNFSCQNACQ